MKLEVEKIAEELKAVNPDRLIIVTEDPDMLVEFVDISEEPNFKPESLPGDTLIFVANIWLSNRYLPYRCFCIVYYEEHPSEPFKRRNLLHDTFLFFAMKKDTGIDRFTHDAANYHTLSIYPKISTYVK